MHLSERVKIHIAREYSMPWSPNTIPLRIASHLIYTTLILGLGLLDPTNHTLFAQYRGGFPPLGAPQYRQPGSAAPTGGEPSTEQELQQMFADITREIARLDDAGQTDDATQMQAELDALRGRLDGPYQVDASDEPEVHVVWLGQGSAAPPGVLEGTERFRRGYAEVQITYTARPVILVLYAREWIHWQIDAAEGVKFFAVVASGQVAPTVPHFRMSLHRRQPRVPVDDGPAPVEFRAIQQ
jgi:hypothetical protein